MAASPIVDDVTMAEAMSAALHRIMSETQDVAVNHHNKDKARMARRLLSRHQNKLIQVGLVWVPGQGIKLHGKP